MSPDYDAYDSSGRLLAEERAGDNAPPLTVSELSASLKRTVEDRFGHVRLRGEISGFKRAASGHLYLCLKDDNAVIDGVMWKGGAQRLAFAAQDGVEVIATGKLTTYPGRSKYQIVIDRMELAGEGALMALLEKLKGKLAGEGLFAPERKKPLPFLPRTIGVVTSPTGAVIRDILHRLSDRCPTDVLVWPVLVQGQGAAEQVARAVRGFSEMAAGGMLPRAEMVIVARGGGSIEDLWSFNEEIVVRAVADCTIPIISAVGHETDTTLCDYAADRRAPTPTAAAEMAVPVRAELLAGLSEMSLRAGRAVRRGAAQARERLDMQARLMPTPDTLLSPQRQRLDDASMRLQHGLRHRLADARAHLSEAGAALRPPLLKQHLTRAAERLDRLRLRPDYLMRALSDRSVALDRVSRHFASLDPDLPLQRGYARITAQGQLVKSVEEAQAAAAVTLHFRDGAVEATVGPLEPGPAADILPARSPRRTREPTAGRQQDLFS